MTVNLKPGRNDPCPCGSGKKFKKCCQDRYEVAQPAVKAPPRAAEISAVEIDNLVALFNAGRYADLESRASMLVRQYPGAGFVWKALGAARRLLGQESLHPLQMAARLLPRDAEAHSNLANTLRELGQLEEAVSSYRRALTINPEVAEFHYNLGITFDEMGKPKEAEASYRRALQIRPDYVDARGNLLLLLNFDPDRSTSEYLAEARQFGLMVSRMVTARFEHWSCAREPDRLRIGFVSGDLRNHAVGYFMESILGEFDLAKVELVAYSASAGEEELTARIKPHFSAWRSLHGLDDESAARLIHSDGIHILVDLSGHTEHSRLPVFAWKPAPVQVSWQGYLASTGVAEIDYFLGDPYVSPAHEAGHFTEKIWQLPESYMCFTEPDLMLTVGPLPAAGTGHITFGSLNGLKKMSDATVALWSRVLGAVPDSKLLLKTKLLNAAGMQEQTRQRFARHGIASDRLILEGSGVLGRAEFLATYNRIDIALDSFPYVGCTTSIEALWMGAPVLTKRGDRFLSHVGETIAFNAGLPEWVAADEDDYVAKAVAHAADLDRLAAIRAGLRSQVLGSSLFDAARFARHFEQAMYGMWNLWLTQNRCAACE